MPALAPQPGQLSASAAGEGSFRAALAGVLALLFVLCLRVLVSFDPIPGWGGDPLELEAPIIGLTPMGSLIIDAITLTASALILLAMSRRGCALPNWQTLCLAGGAVAVALHARVLAGASLINLVTGSSWLAAFTGAFAGVQAAREPRLRSLMVATLLGLIAPLVIKGAVQYYIEQPESFKMFLSDKERILSANGWTVDSPMARAYQRRLEQPEATGWFGMSNVFATLAAASIAALAGLSAVLAGRRKRGPGQRAADPGQSMARAFLAIGCGLAAVGVYLAGSKGGYATTALGIGLLVLAALATRSKVFGAPHAEDPSKRRGVRGNGVSLAGPLVAIAMPVVALGAVALRGLLGERLHELSLWFRWFYLETAARVFVKHPLLGTGPDGFKDGYMLLKPAISPEDVSSPHSIFFDLGARLGVGGLLLGVLLVAWLWRAGKSLLPRTVDSSPSWAALEHGPRLLLVVIAAATAAAAILEQPAATLTSTLVRAGGLAGFMMIGVGVLHAMRSRAAMAAFGNTAVAVAAVAALTHCQIELTGVTPGANLWVFLLLACAAAIGDPPCAPAGRSARGLVASALVVGMLILLVPFGIVPVARWDLAMREAYRLVEPVSGLALRADAIAQGKPLPGDTAASLADDLSKELAISVTPAQILQASSELRYTRASAALKGPMAVAMEVWPSDSETYHAAARLMLQLAVMESRAGHAGQAGKYAERAEVLAQSYCASRPPSPAQLAWLGMIRRGWYEFDHKADHLSGAVEAWKKAAELAPHEPLYAAQLARTYALLKQPEEAATWAGRALSINEEVRLDPLRQFSPRDERELRQLLGGHPPAPAEGRSGP
jgi:hypothetical protein